MNKYHFTKIEKTQNLHDAFEKLRITIIQEKKDNLIFNSKQSQYILNICDRALIKIKPKVQSAQIDITAGYTQN